MINCCFVANHSRTYLYGAISKALKKELDIRVFWIFTNNNFLSQIEKDNYIVLGFDVIKQKNSPVNDFRLHELIAADRLLRCDTKKAYDFLTSVQKPLYEFIKNNNINFVFGENTWALELLVSRMCHKQEELHCRYLAFEPIRIPSNRFAFFEDENQTKIVKFDNTLPTEFIIEKPNSFSMYNTYAVSRNNRIQSIIRAFKYFSKNLFSPRVLHPFTNNDPLDCSFFDAIVAIHRNRKHYMYYKKLKKADFNSYKDKKYIFYGLQIQPESSVDVFGRIYNDQYRNIYNLWRLLPQDWYLLIKEHPSIIGFRDKKFYRDILKLNRVILLKEETDSKLIIANAQISVTITGTLALEAALMNKPVILFAKTMFSDLPNIHQLSIDELARMDLTVIKPVESNNKIEKYQDFIMKNSFPGCLFDVKITKDVLHEDNIRNLASGFIKLFSQEKKVQY